MPAGTVNTDWTTFLDGGNQEKMIEPRALHSSEMQLPAPIVQFGLQET
jgi:hypothetical protein